MTSKPILKHFLINKLRRISYQWGPRRQAIVRARVSRGKYRCSCCEGENFGPTEIQVDHTDPVIDPHEGFKTWDEYINRLFCGVDGLSVMCKNCHSYKSAFENMLRKDAKQEEKKDEDDDI